MLFSCSTADIFSDALFLRGPNHTTHYYTSHVLLEVEAEVLLGLWYWYGMMIVYFILFV